MAKRNTFILNSALTLTIAISTIFLNREAFWDSMSVPVKIATSEASVYYAMNDTTQSTYTGVMNLTSSAAARAFEGRSQRNGEPSASFTVSQLAGIARGVTRYADGQLSSNCTSGNYSIANRNCRGSDGNAYISLQAASNASAAGDTILIRAFNGVYTGSGTKNAIVPKAGSSISVRTTYSGYQNERPTVQAIGNGDASGDYLYIKNLIIDMQNVAESYMGNTAFSKYENLEIKNGGLHGVLGIGSSELINLDVHHNGFNAGQCTAHPTQCHGVYNAPATSSDPRGNFNTFDGGRYHHNAGYGIHCYSHCAGTTIRNLRVDHNGWIGIIVLDGAGTVVYNVVADNNPGVGIQLIQNGAVLYNVTSYSNASGGIQLRNEASSMTVKNTIALDGIGNCSINRNVCSNNITSGNASSYFVDAANGNFQLLPTRKVRGIGADLSSPKY
jgi:hypothetical protein